MLSRVTCVGVCASYFFVCVQTHLFFCMIWLMVILRDEQVSSPLSTLPLSRSPSFEFRVSRNRVCPGLYIIKKYGVFFSERSCALRVTVHGTAYTLSVKVNDYTTALLDTTRVQSDAILSPT